MSEEKDFYTTQELVKESWFPIKSTITLKKMIENGELEAYNVSVNPNLKRYRITKESVIRFLVSRKGKK